jgi:phosphoglycolate phosphatase-like HAD superfamily hydrolase
MRLKDMPESAIFDFDGTLTNLDVDWKEVRRALGISRISDIWSLSKSTLNYAINVISEFETSGLTNVSLVERERLESFQQFSVLTNNSERTVEYFFKKLNLDPSQRNIAPTKIVGRETLLAPKEDEGTFIRGIEINLTAMKISPSTSCLYVGDQHYELEFAIKSGLNAVSIDAFLQM